MSLTKGSTRSSDAVKKRRGSVQRAERRWDAAWLVPFPANQPMTVMQAHTRVQPNSEDQNHLYAYFNLYET